MNKLELLRTFVRVSELSSFTQAADSLGLPRSTVSDQVLPLAVPLLYAHRRLPQRVRAFMDWLEGLIDLEVRHDHKND